MGKGRHNPSSNQSSPEEIDEQTISNGPHRLPTLSEIKVKIPSHCFRPTVAESMSYVVKDVAFVAITFLMMNFVRNHFEYGFLLFPLYWYIQG